MQKYLTATKCKICKLQIIPNATYIKLFTVINIQDCILRA